jgi:hypothetical protein
MGEWIASVSLENVVPRERAVPGSRGVRAVPRGLEPIGLLLRYYGPLRRMMKGGSVAMWVPVVVAMWVPVVLRGKSTNDEHSNRSEHR